MGAISALGLRLERRRWQVRAFRKGRDLSEIADRSGMVGPNAVLLFATIRNEKPRLPYFLKYYRDLGVEHFFVVDNGSSDGTAELLAAEPDVSLWQAETSYKHSRFGTDWLNWLKFRFGHGHWTLTVDPDEFLVFPFCDTRPLPALCDWLDQSGLRALGTILVDMYPKGPPDQTVYTPGQNPFEIAQWFDAGNYTVARNKRYGNLWIQGGPRARVYFPDAPEQAPSLNKIPLVKWERKYVHVSSTHMLLPRGLNLVYDEAGGEKASGCLLHAKFLDSFPQKAAEEVERRQHFARGREYDAYHLKGQGPNGLWCDWSERYIDWRQLELLGLMSKGNWA
jgi:hypothetical protein